MNDETNNEPKSLARIAAENCANAQWVIAEEPKETIIRYWAGEFERIISSTYESAEAEARRLREALEAYMFLEQTSGGLNPHRPGSNKYRAFELGRAALTPTPEAGKDK